MTPWPLKIDDREFHPIPESWVTHPHATAEDGPGAQLLAVSAARTADASLAVRYAHLASQHVLAERQQSVHHNTGTVPRGLETGSGWPRAIRARRREPADVLRECEREHLRALWGDRLEEIDTVVEAEREVFVRV